MIIAFSWWYHRSKRQQKDCSTIEWILSKSHSSVSSENNVFIWSCFTFTCQQLESLYHRLNMNRWLYELRWIPHLSKQILFIRVICTPPGKETEREGEGRRSPRNKRWRVELNWLYTLYNTIVYDGERGKRIRKKEQHSPLPFLSLPLSLSLVRSFHWGN